MATSIKVNSRVKNLINSGKYITMDVLKSYAPVMSSLTKSAAETTKTGYQAIKDFTSSSPGSGFTFEGLKEKGKESISNVWKNTIDDLKTGKIYNKERKEALDNELMSGFFGDMDLDFNFDDFDDWGDDEDVSSTDETKAQVAAQVEGTKAVINAVDAMGRGISASVTEATVESASYIASSAREDNLALFNLNKAGYASINKALMSVNDTIYNFSKIGEPLTAHMQNSLNFFAKTEGTLNNIEQSLKQIEKNTTPVVAVGKNGYKQKKSLADVMSDDNGIDFSELGDMMKTTVNEYKELLSFFGSFTKGTTGNNLKNVSLANMGGTFLIKKLIPKAIEESIKDLDKSVKYGLGAGLTKLAQGKGTKNDIVNFLLGELLPGRDTKRNIDSGQYEKGPVAWDGVARKALVDVIPTTLLEIYSVLSGSPSMRFDYKSGKFVKSSSLIGGLEATKRRYVEESGGKLYEEIVKKINDSEKNEKKKQKMLAEAYKYFEKAFDTGDHEIMAKSLDIDPATYAIIKAVAQSRLNRGGAAARSINKWVVESNIKSADYANYLRGEEAGGINPILTLHDELRGEGKNSGAKGNRNTIIGLDEYGHNYYWYLQGIWQFTNFLANNVTNFGRVDEDGELNQGDNIADKNMPSIPINRSRERTTKEANQYLGMYYTEEEEHARHVKENKKKFSKWIEDHLSNKTRKVVNDVFGTELTTEEFTMVGILDSITNSIDRLLFGDENNPEKGLFSTVYEKTEEMFGNAKNWFQEHVIDKLKEKISDKYNKFLASGFVEDTKRVLGNIKDSTLGSVRRIFIGNNGEAAYGRKITKSGIVTVSEGELIIPSEYNPFYHGATNKAAQIANERRIGGGFPGFAKGDVEYFTKDGDTVSYNEKIKRWQRSNGKLVGKANVVYRDTSGKWFDVNDKQVNPPSFASFKDKFDNVKGKVADDSYAGLLLTGVSNAFYGIKSKVDEMTSDEQIQKDKEKISENIKKALGEAGGAKGEMGAGAILGVVGSIFTGGIIGPIAGAALGAGIGLLTKSKVVQDFIFGKEEAIYDPETGETVMRRKRQEIFDLLKKTMPSTGKGALIGSAAGIFMGSPVIGAFLGAGIGFASSSEKFKTWLLGSQDQDNGVIPKDVQDKVKKALPNIVLGATGGALLGPFGLVGNILLGSAIGFSATSGKLHDAIFGKEGDGDSEKESILYIVKEKIFGGLDNIFHNMGNRVRVFLTDLGKNIRNRINKKIDKLKLDAESGNASIGSRILAGALDTGRKVADWTVRLPFRIAGGIVGKIDDRIQQGNLRAGYSTYNRAEKRNMTAQERLDTRINKGIWAEDKIFDKFDKFLVSLESYDELKYYKNIMEILRTAPQDSVQYQRAMSMLMNDRKYGKFKEFMKASGKNSEAKLKSFFKKHGTKIGNLIQDEAAREGLSEEEQKNIRAMKTIDLLQTTTDYIRAIFEKGIKIRSNNSSDSINDGIQTLADNDGELRGPNADLLANVSNPNGVIRKNKRTGTETMMAPDVETGKVVKWVQTAEGKWELQTRDKDTSQSVKTKSKFIETISNLPTTIGGIGGKLKEALFGDGEEKEGIFGKVKKFLSKIANKIIKPLVGIAAVGFGIYALFKSLFGGQDSFLNKMLNKLGSKIGFGAPSDNPWDNGGTKTQFQDAEGNILKVDTDENGITRYFNDAGEMVDPSEVRNVRAGKDTMLTRFRKTNVRQFILSGGKVGSTMAGAMAKKMITSNKYANRAIQIGSNVAKDVSPKILKKIGLFLDKLTADFPKIAERIPVDEATKVKLIEKFPKCTDELLDALDNSRFIKAVSGLWKNFEDLVPVLNIIAAVGDFISGWEDARTTLGITDNPTKPQRLIAGLLRLVKNLIPVVGPFIPDDLVVNVFVKVLGSVIKGMDSLKEQRSKAQQEVESYNAAHGTNYTVAEYNKSVLNDYTFGERIGNTFKTAKQQFGDKKSALKQAFKERGITGVIDEYNGISKMFNAYKESGGGVTGMFDAMIAWANNIPGNEIGAKSIELTKYAFTGDKRFFDPNETTLSAFKDSAAEGGVKSSIFSKYIGQLPMHVMKFTLTPIAISTTISRTLFDKVTSKLKPIKDDYNNFKSYVSTMLKGDQSGEIATGEQAQYKATSMLAPVFNFGAKIIKIGSVLKNLINKVTGYISVLTGGLIGGDDSVVAKLSKGDVSGAISTITTNIATKTTVGKMVTTGVNMVKGAWNWITGNSSSSSSGSGSGLRGGASALGVNGSYNTIFQSQLDPNYRNISFGGSNVGKVGCGPAVATMASRSMGGDLTMKSAIDKARSYTNNDGTSTKYFEDVLGASPLNNTSVVKQSLESGRPVILLGRDPSNTSKEKSPFGPNNHYVLASAMKNGKVLVNDPESRGPRMYDQSILNKSRYNLTYGGYSGMGTTGVAATDVSDTIWNTLKANGFSDAAAAGILGNAQQESGMSPTADAAAYGLFQFEKSTGAASGLENYASGLGKSKDDVETQTNYMLSLFKNQVSAYSGNGTHTYSNGTVTWWPTKVTYDDYKKLTDAEEAAEIFERTYERPSIPMREQRKAYAADFLEIYGGTENASNGTSTSSSDESSSETSETQDQGLLAQLSNIFGSFGNIFNINKGFSINSSSSSSSSDSSTTKTGGTAKGNFNTNAKGAQAAANAASNEIGYAESGNNITKFGEWSGCNGQPWCAAFAAWAISQAFDGSKDKAVEALYNCSNINYTPTLTDTFKANNAWYQEPEVGDEVMYGNPGAYHVGLVTSVDKDAKTFQSVEGNSSDKVQLKDHSGYLEGNVIGFGRPDYSGATTNVTYNGNKVVAAVDGDSTDFKATGSGLRGGSSGLLRKFAPSRFAYGSTRKYGKGSGLVSKNRFRGAGSDMSATVTRTLTNIKTNLTRNNGNISGIDPQLVAELLASITGLLNSIADNTAPVERIYNVLSEYIDYVKGGSNVTTSGGNPDNRVNMPTGNNDIDSNIQGLVASLAAIARG